MFWKQKKYEGPDPCPMIPNYMIKAWSCKSFSSGECLEKGPLCKYKNKFKVKFIKELIITITMFLYEWKLESNCVCAWDIPDHSDSGCSGSYGCYLFHDLTCGEHLKCYAPRVLKKRWVKKEQAIIDKLADDL
jgi:hypothetical protein